MSGRLALSWINKDRALLSNPDSGYMWTERNDLRLTEARLFKTLATEGSVQGQRDNALIIGDCQHVLRTLEHVPEFADTYRGKVKLAYLDPPFNTGEAFAEYDDGIEHSIWLAMMRERLLLIKELLSPDGSIWVHLDDSEMPYCRVLMDEIFGRGSFVASVVWQKRYSRDNRPAVGSVHDYIMVYAPMGIDWKYIRNRIARAQAKEYRNPNNDPRGAWRPIPMDVQAGHATASQFYTVHTPGGARHDPPSGRAWSVVKEKMDELRDAGRVYFGLDGRGKPNVIRYLDEDEGLVPWTWWPHTEVGHNDDSKKEIISLFPGINPFTTPKPERLMKRIIEIATNPGEIVLDPFLGSGTTAAVATKLRRRWIAIEASRQTVFDFARPRLSKVVAGEDRGGITGESEWTGGSGYRLCELDASLYTVAGDRILLSDFATGDFFARSVAAQLKFKFDPHSIFVGRRGRSHLLVVDGVVDNNVVHSAVAALDEGDETVIAGKAVEPGAREALNELSLGSRVVKVPSDLVEKTRVIR